jgi:hypothetical protein
MYWPKAERFEKATLLAEANKIVSEDTFIGSD